jgi:hypothetical protein
LALVREFISRHKGTVSVQSEVGKVFQSNFFIAAVRLFMLFRALPSPFGSRWGSFTCLPLLAPIHWRRRTMRPRRRASQPFPATRKRASPRLFPPPNQPLPSP